MLCQYCDIIVPDMSSSSTYNDKSNMLLNGNLGMLYTKRKKKLNVMDMGKIIMILKFI